MTLDKSPAASLFQAPGVLRVLVFSLVLLTVYAGGYFALSTIFVGRFNKRTIKIRLFDSNWQVVTWQPLIRLEQMIRKDAFYGQVWSGASLPPSAN